MEQDYVLTPEIEMNYTWLDQFDFSDYLKDGIDFYELLQNLSNQYDEIIYNEYGLTLFEFMADEDIMIYLNKRYGVRFAPIKSWRLYRYNGSLQ